MTKTIPMNILLNLIFKLKTMLKWTISISISLQNRHCAFYKITTWNAKRLYSKFVHEIAYFNSSAVLAKSSNSSFVALSLTPMFDLG